MAHRLDLVTNLAFVGLCVVGMALGVQALFRPAAPPARGAVQPPAPPMYEPGERIAVAGVDFGLAERTLVLVLKQGCRFCDESLPFYRTLGPTRAAGVRLVVAAPDDVAVSRAELAAAGVDVDEVVQVPLGALKVRGTPTAILVARPGVVRQVWVGRLDEARQREVVTALVPGL